MRETAEQRQERLHCVAGLAQQLHALENLRFIERDEQKREDYETEMMTVMEAIRRVRTEPRRRV
jgi:ABC-type transport system involved in cytochrome c biogenesis ATPase subunit